MANIYLDNSSYVEFISELAGEMTYLAYGLDTYKFEKDEDGEESQTTIYTDDAQDYFNSSYDYIETRLNMTLGVYNNTDLINKN